MNSYTVKLKQTNMLCNKCVMHVLQALTMLDEIQELEVDLEKKLVKVVYNDESVSKEMVAAMVKNAIEVRIPKKVSSAKKYVETEGVVYGIPSVIGKV